MVRESTTRGWQFRARAMVLMGIWVLLLAACGGSEDEAAFAETTESVQLQVVVFDSFSPNADEVLREKITSWGAENGVEVELITSLPAGPEQMLASDQFPGCGMAWNLNYWIVNDALVETTELVAELDEAAGGYLPNALLPSRMLGKQWAVPIALVNSVFFVRQDKLDEASLPLPDTWDDARHAAESMTILDEFYGWGMQIGRSGDTETAFRTKLWSYGGSVWDEEGKPALDSAATRQVLDFVASVWRSDLVPPDAVSWDDSTNNQAYLDGRVGMVLNAGSLLNRLQREEPDLLAKTVVLPPPAGPAGRFSPGNVTHWVIFKQSESVDLCMDLTRWLLAPDQLRDYYAAGNGNYLPVHAGLLADPIWQEEPGRRVLADQAPNTADAGYPGPVTPWALDARGDAIIGDMVRNVLLEGWNHDEAIAEADEALWALYDSWQEQLR